MCITIVLGLILIVGRLRRSVRRRRMIIVVIFGTGGGGGGGGEHVFQVGTDVGDVRLTAQPIDGAQPNLHVDHRIEVQTTGATRDLPLVERWFCELFTNKFNKKKPKTEHLGKYREVKVNEDQQ